MLPQAAHWATISNIYHKSADARRAFDLAVAALDQGRQLFVIAAGPHPTALLYGYVVESMLAPLEAALAAGDPL